MEVLASRLELRAANCACGRAPCPSVCRRKGDGTLNPEKRGSRGEGGGQGSRRTEEPGEGGGGERLQVCFRSHDKSESTVIQYWQFEESVRRSGSILPPIRPSLPLFLSQSVLPTPTIASRARPWATNFTRVVTPVVRLVPPPRLSCRKGQQHPPTHPSTHDDAV